ncbi:hypothetical protein GCM10022222_10140 [Amycolatopsis ultiminotia]|uniref:FAD-binding PCMH-type domain-containing protein n=1 Tax=Amycolatopsis ultiminotia TaxID=543629 RepID=A0ABP6V8Z6_9PSEU
MTRQLIEAEHVVDLKDLGLAGIRRVDGAVEIGARATYSEVLGSPLLREDLPLLPRTADGVTGGRQLTLQATLVGAACLGFPSADVPGALAALDAQVRIEGPDGGRTIGITDFLVDAYTIDLQPGEFVRSLRFAPPPSGGRCKVKHSSGSWPFATAGAVRVVVRAAQAVPVIVPVDAADDPAELTNRVTAAIAVPWSAVPASGKYRAEISPVVARRAAGELVGG